MWNPVKGRQNDLLKTVQFNMLIDKAMFPGRVGLCPAGSLTSLSASRKPENEIWHKWKTADQTFSETERTLMKREK